MKRLYLTVILCLLSVCVGAAVCHWITLDRQRVPGDLRSPLIAASGLQVSYVENVGVYDVCREVAPSGASLLLMNSARPGLYFNIPDGNQDAPVSMGTPAQTWFRRWAKAGTNVATYASAVDQNGRPGDQVWDSDGDGRFDKMATATGTKYYLLEGAWVKVISLENTDDDPAFDLLQTDTGMVYRRVNDAWVRESPSSHPSGGSPFVSP